MGWGGGLLHSHVQTYPVGSNQQQVTCYQYKDSNNDWVITPTWDDPPIDPNGPIRYLADGDAIRLVHSATSRNLHSHMVPAPISKELWEVSCYGNSTVGDFHDYWVVEVVDDVNRGGKSHVDRIHSLTTRLRFRHQTLGCYLRAANKPLPEWGFKQIEVTCDKENNPSDAQTYWNVESHWNDRCASNNSLTLTWFYLNVCTVVSPGDYKYYRSPFLRDFWHLNVAMMTSNNALIPDPDKEDILASNPTDWPFLRLGLRMCGWGDDITKYYLLGTPVIWWGGAVSLLLGVIAFGVYVLRMHRKHVDMEPSMYFPTPQDSDRASRLSLFSGEWDHFVYVGKIALFGWILHYRTYHTSSLLP